jgi:hypothetical protein
MTEETIVLWGLGIVMATLVARLWTIILMAAIATWKAWKGAL